MSAGYDEDERAWATRLARAVLAPSVPAPVVPLPVPATEAGGAAALRRRGEDGPEEERDG